MKLTRKIQLVVDLPTKDERKEALDKLYHWRYCCFKASNLIISHLYVQEMMKEFFYLSDGLRHRLVDEKKNEDGMLNRSRINCTYRMTSDRFKGEMPTNILTNLNSSIRYIVNMWWRRKTIRKFPNIACSDISFPVSPDSSC